MSILLKDFVAAEDIESTCRDILLEIAYAADVAATDQSHDLEGLFEELGRLRQDIGPGIFDGFVKGKETRCCQRARDALDFIVEFAEAVPFPRDDTISAILAHARLGLQEDK